LRRLLGVHQKAIEMVLRIVESELGDVAVVTLSGQLTMGREAEELKERFQRLVAEKRMSILVNIDEVSYIDSYGVGELVALLSAVKKSGGSLKLVKPSDFVREVLRTTRLDTLFALYDSEEEALADFTRPDQAASGEQGAE
jgi:anti-sigma B factor antagonist